MEKPSTLVAPVTPSTGYVKDEDGKAPLYPMHINLNVINNAPPRINTNYPRADPFGFEMDMNTPCESPVYSDAQTPGGSIDVSKKQRHNLREQRRIFRIGTQFEQLKKKLEGVGFVSSKKDKHSILQATIEYIAALEREANAAGIGPPPPPTTGGSCKVATPATLPRGHSKENSMLSMNASNHYMFNAMASPVPTPMAMDYMWALPTGAPQVLPAAPLETVDESSATFKNVFFQSSMPALITKLDGTIVEANHLFLELSQAKYDELRLHSLYTMCAPSDAPKMHTLVAKILSCEVSSAQAKMSWRFGSSSLERKVFVSVSVIRDDAMQPVNVQCCILPLS
ncbi:hypothetical protein SDRG_05410 [Saprolegnia diclina VS20]|uniref:BHLH domain-containing protein n=1 Tax=Saprolegnia diclina (strain VS20) TaxID=1156394 RepID=T0QGT7_SAPDV|nr:hypothetical protein SDRG_05410 [Saprolegnia diclina VS20]EQC37184.1 hypothetical protein SDRG_05410 [Saprolegnia diclina VS20]|eukprot:XP_008609346.1 hypothetical protein SDRG_05410 [Saprolegnia diclina VS20]